VINKRVGWNCGRSYYWFVFLWGESQLSKLFTLPSKRLTRLVETGSQSSTPHNVVSTGRSTYTQSSNCQNLFKQKISESMNWYRQRNPWISSSIAWFNSLGFRLMSKTLSMQKNQRPKKTRKTAFEKRAGVLLQLYSTMLDEHSAVVSSVAFKKTDVPLNI